MTDFMPGDKVQAVIEGVLDDNENHRIANLRGLYEINGVLVPKRFIKLIKKAEKPELKINQIWSDGKHEYTIIGFYNDYVVYWSKTVNRAFDASVNLFYKYYAHKLIGEGQNDNTKNC